MVETYKIGALTITVEPRSSGMSTSPPGRRISSPRAVDKGAAPHQPASAALTGSGAIG